MKFKKVFLIVLASLVLIFVGWWFFPTSTAPLSEKNSISELKNVSINQTKQSVMIRGKNKKNPLLLIVHGGPSCSEIPYATKYQKQLERDFTVVHYDQRGSGKSYQFGTNYSQVNSQLLVKDLLQLTDYLRQRFKQDKIMLMGHSYGTYLSLQAITEAPEKYLAYVGVGQMGDTQQSEADALAYCIAQAKKEKNAADISLLKSLEKDDFVPRDLVRKYGGAARLINDNQDYVSGFLLGSEYNLSDVVGFFRGIAETQEQLVNEPCDQEFLNQHSQFEVSIIFAMGKYDYMTSHHSAKAYFNQISAPNKKFVTFTKSAHYPQFEEQEKFSQLLRKIYQEQVNA